LLDLIVQQNYYNNHFTALWILYGTTWVSRYQKGKTNLDLLEQERAGGSGISWATCKPAPRSIDNHTSIPPVSVLQVGYPSCRPTNSVKAPKDLLFSKIWLESQLLYLWYSIAA